MSGALVPRRIDPVIAPLPERPKTRINGRIPHLVIMAAGTGGHIIPGLAVAKEVIARGWTVSWMGTTHGLENRLVPPTNVPLDTLDFSGLRGKGWKHSLTGVWKLAKACVRARSLLQRRRAHVVLGMGGYVCVPGGWMAHWLRKPLLLVNADAALLLSNKTLMSYADRVAFGFDGQAKDYKRGVVTGNPVREEIEAIAPPAERYKDREGPLRVLVVGGSLGAQVLNRTLPEALKLLPEEARPEVVHQTGPAQWQETRDAYAAAGVQAEVLPFIDDMAARLGHCDLIVCRAGAVTVSELCAAGVAAILVPLVLGTTSHQRDNAQYMEKHGAARHLPQTHLSPQGLAEQLQQLQRPDLQRMAEAARALARPQAAARVADEIEKLLKKLEKPAK
ncbi:MAG: putative undecaprenyldiphospho-muramoylpentapeptide b-N-acetylglucosaminyltransferase [Pseudomonadota bacterium]|jgi:UDP-N-acetylglucosamine--N-acetylmuramyl-(pentapeptide) pyrophosphoryl-undecaprenol N-acetylglucosamine transferase